VEINMYFNESAAMLSVFVIKTRGGNGVAELWEEFSHRGDELKLIASAIRAAAGERPRFPWEVCRALEVGTAENVS
jgi:hypothetical protein